MYSEIAPEIEITFDKPLRPGVLNVPNWSGRQADRVWVPETPPTALGSVVSFRTTPGIIQPGPDVVSYAASPPDVVSTPGLVPAAAFTNYPVT